MSSFIVNDKTINRILSFLAMWNFGENVKLKQKLKNLSLFIETNKDLQEFGQDLKKLNYEAVKQRYEKLSKEEVERVDNFKFKDEKCDIYQAYQHLRCLTYQMAEGDIPETDLYKVMQEVELQLERSIALITIEKLSLEWEAK